METFAVLRQCSGCKACELACSFRATGAFWPAASAIKVARLYDETGVRFEVRVDTAGCDLCEDEKMPRCQLDCDRGVLDRTLIAGLRGGLHA